MKTNEKRLWFVRRKYGWGWTPVTWEGWLCLAVYAIAIASDAIWFGSSIPNQNPWSPFIYLAVLFGSTALML